MYAFVLLKRDALAGCILCLDTVESCMMIAMSVGTLGALICSTLKQCRTKRCCFSKKNSALKVHLYISMYIREIQTSAIVLWKIIIP